MKKIMIAAMVVSMVFPFMVGAQVAAPTGKDQIRAELIVLMTQLVQLEQQLLAQQSNVPEGAGAIGSAWQATTTMENLMEPSSQPVCNYEHFYPADVGISATQGEPGDVITVTGNLTLAWCVGDVAVVFKPQSVASGTGGPDQFNVTAPLTVAGDGRSATFSVPRAAVGRYFASFRAVGSTNYPSFNLAQSQGYASGYPTWMFDIEAEN